MFAKLLSLALLGVLVHTQLVCGVVVQTESGPVRGFVKDDTARFLGIPFALPPTGPNRFRPPQVPAKSWAPTTLDATQYRASCEQHREGNVHDKAFVLDEDCLFLNVYAPATFNANASGDKKLPVMVWIYGGSFLHGTGTFYDGAELVHAQENAEVIVVNMNYRLGAFGFMYSEKLRLEDPKFETAGLYGMQDQQAALKWVQLNIAQFGGDKDRVTLFGESAGAISVCNHLALKSSHGLFSRALMESGFCLLKNRTDCTARGDKFATDLGCAGGEPACLRSKTAQEVLAVQHPTDGWWPCIDGTEYTEQPLVSIEKGAWNAVPVVAGTNKREEALFICPKYANITTTDYANLVYGKYGEQVGRAILQMYPPNATDPAWPLISLESDLVFKCPTKWVLDAVEGRSQPTWMYSFVHTPVFAGHLNSSCLDVPAHSYELPFLFPSLEQIYGTSLDPAEQQLGHRMAKAWNLFANGGSPWTAYDQTGAFVELDIESWGFGTHFRQKECDLWKKIIHF